VAELFAEVYSSLKVKTDAAPDSYEAGLVMVGRLNGCAG
jgi:hypothetical protein